MPVSRDDSLTQAMIPGDFPSGGYMVVSAGSSAALQELVQKYVAQGWKMLGVPVAREANISQALISADADVSSDDTTDDSADDDSDTDTETSSEPDFWYVLVLAGQSNGMAYGEGLPLPETLDAPHARIKQLARRSTVTPGGDACSYNDIIPADHCLHDVQDMSGYNHPNADLDKGEYGCVGQGLHIAKKLLSWLPDNAGILLVPCCRGGSAFTTGSDGTFSETSGATESSTLWGTPTALYQDLIFRTKAALDKNPLNRLLAVVWMQGEYDLTTSSYASQPEMFTELVEQFRSDLTDYAAQMPECSAAKVPWICGDTTYYWKETYPTQYATVYGAYDDCDAENVVFVPFMYDEDGNHTPTNLPADDPDITEAGYYGAASRTKANWVSSSRPTHFSSWARRGIIAERLASAIVMQAGRRALLGAPAVATETDTASGDSTTSTTVYAGGLLSYSPDIETVEYNGRRGDGLPASQGWTTSGGTFSVSENDDGLGGYVLTAEKESGSPWTMDYAVSGGADILTYGGEALVRFRITDESATNGRYAFGLYWLLDSSDIPSGVSFNRTGSSATPSLLNLFVQTDSSTMYLYMHCNKANSTELSNIKLATIGEFDNEWHEIRVVYKGGVTARATLYVDSVSVGDFTLAATPASVSTNTVEITSVTKNTSYNVELSLFRARVFRDDGTVALGSDDVSSTVWFPDDSRGGGVVLPDADISPGNTVKIFYEGEGDITVSPATDEILIVPQGDTEGYPSAVAVTGNTRLVQTDTSGRTWRVMSEDSIS